MAPQDLVGRLLSVSVRLPQTVRPPHEGVLVVAEEDPLGAHGLDNHSRITDSLQLEKELANWLKY